METPNNKQVKVGDIVTTAELKLASKLRNAKDICEQITKPNIERINKSLGQQNDPMYLAYLLEYVVTTYSVTKR